MSDQAKAKARLETVRQHRDSLRIALQSGSTEMMVRALTGAFLDMTIVLVDAIEEDDPSLKG